VQRDLQILGSAWFSRTSCFRPADLVPHAEPSPDDLVVVLDQLKSANFDVAGAAFSALRSFAVVCRQQAYPTIPSSIWDLPGVPPAVRDCLVSEQAGARLRAAAFACDFPSDCLRDALVRCLEDPLFTVRWRAIRAMAALGSTIELIPVLGRCTPAVVDPRRHFDFIAALEAIGMTHEDILKRNAG
jgi:HEAT repeat protein